MKTELKVEVQDGRVPFKVSIPKVREQERISLMQERVSIIARIRIIN